MKTFMKKLLITLTILAMSNSIFAQETKDSTQTDTVKLATKELPLEPEREYTKEGVVEKKVEKELTNEEKQKLLKEQEDAAIAKIIEKARTQKQMSCL